MRSMYSVAWLCTRVYEFLDCVFSETLPEWRMGRCEEGYLQDQVELFIRNICAGKKTLRDVQTRLV